MEQKKNQILVQKLILFLKNDFSIIIKYLIFINILEIPLNYILVL